MWNPLAAGIHTITIKSQEKIRQSKIIKKSFYNDNYEVNYLQLFVLCVDKHVHN